MHLLCHSVAGGIHWYYGGYLVKILTKRRSSSKVTCRKARGMWPRLKIRHLFAAFINRSQQN